MKQERTLNELLNNVKELNAAIIVVEGKKEKLLPKIYNEVKELKRDYSFLEIQKIVEGKIKNLNAKTLNNVKNVIELSKYNFNINNIYIKDLEQALKIIKACKRLNKDKTEKLIDYINSKDMPKKDVLELLKKTLNMLKKEKSELNKKKNFKNDEKKNSKKDEKKNSKNDEKKNSKNEPLKLEDKNQIIDVEVEEDDLKLDEIDELKKHVKEKKLTDEDFKKIEKILETLF